MYILSILNKLIYIFLYNYCVDVLTSFIFLNPNIIFLIPFANIQISFTMFDNTNFLFLFYFFQLQINTLSNICSLLYNNKMHRNAFY